MPKQSAESEYNETKKEQKDASLDLIEVIVTHSERKAKSCILSNSPLSVEFNRLFGWRESFKMSTVTTQNRLQSLEMYGFFELSKAV